MEEEMEVTMEEMEMTRWTRLSVLSCQRSLSRAGFTWRTCSLASLRRTSAYRPLARISAKTACYHRTAV